VPFVVIVAEASELLSPQQAAERLGFSRQHVMRLIGAGRLEAHRLSPESRYWRIPVESVVAFEGEQEAAAARADEFSRELNRLGAPLE
jgi:excisionase family DNA binding protein